jgi:hypothetical protein
LEERLRNALQGHAAEPPDPAAERSRFSGGSNDQSSAAILANPSHPRFDNLLIHFGRKLQLTQFKAFYWVVIDHFKLPNPIIVEKCMQSFATIVTRDPAFLRAFARVHFFGSLPLSTKMLIARSFQFSIPLFTHHPDLLDQRMGRALGAFILNYPRESAQLFVIYASKFTELVDPYTIIDLFLSYARAFADSPGSTKYLQVLHYLVTACPGFREARFAAVRPIFAYCMRSTDTETAAAAMKAVCATLDGDFKIPFDAICRGLAQPAVARVTLSLLLRLERYPVSRTLCRVLVDRSLKDARAFEALLLFANQNLDCAMIVAKNGKWMQCRSLDALRLMLVCWKYREVRSLITESVLFARFLASVAPLSEDAVCAIAIILRRSPLTQERISALSESKFFHKYYEALVPIADKRILLAANALLDELARAGFAPEFQFFLPLLQKQLAMKNELTSTAISVLVTLSCHPALAAVFRESQLVQYFQALQKVRSLEQRAQLFLSNVAK